MSSVDARDRMCVDLVECFDTVHSLSCEIATTAASVDIDAPGSTAASSASGSEPSNTAAISNGDILMEGDHGEVHDILMSGMGSQFEDVGPLIEQPRRCTLERDTRSTGQG